MPAPKQVTSLNPSYTGIWLRGHVKYSDTVLLSFGVLTLLILEFGFGATDAETDADVIETS